MPDNNKPLRIHERTRPTITRKNRIRTQYQTTGARARLTNMKQSTVVSGLIIVLIIAIVMFLFAQTQIKLAEEREDVVANVKAPESKAGKYTLAKEITTPDGFVNTDGITIGEHIGKKVVLIDFWTYSCINCQRTTPYLNAWYEKYKDKGLEIIGIHTPEFKFEHKYENVADAVERFGIKFPVALDNDFSTWRAYNNLYWPRKYLIDIDGYIVYNHIGEGGYEETEREIQKALDERMTRLALEGSIDTEIAQPENVETANTLGPRSPETYFGALRNKNFGNGTPGETGVRTFTLPSEIQPNTLYLVGEWNITPEYAENVSVDAKIVFYYQAEKVFLVARADEHTEVTIRRDSNPLGDEAGSSTETKNGEATIQIQKDQLYRIIEDPEGSAPHLLEINIEAPGFQAFAFTFG